MATGILNPEGIPAYADAPLLNDTGGNYAAHTVASPQVVPVFVREGDVERARELLIAAWGRIDEAPPTPSGVSPKTTLIFVGACLVLAVALLMYATR